MRDPGRIFLLLALLQSYWRKCPDMRFGQLLETIYSKAAPEKDPFYIEDETIINWLKAQNEVTQGR